MEKPVQPEQPASEPMQETPTGHVIPVPARDSVLAFFKKVAKPKKG
jgi:hypothetical protein